MKFVFLLVPVIFLASCGSGVTEEVKIAADSSSFKEVNVDSSGVKVELANGLEFFQNIEQVDYCVPLPLKDYTLVQDDNRTRAQFDFTCNTNPELQIAVKGLFRTNPEESIQEYFNYVYSPEETELQGIIITEKKITGKNNVFYAKGYMSNFINERRFMEVYWIRKDEVVKIQCHYDIKDTTLWNNRLAQIIETDSYCH